jgi:hypothetical protein
MYALPGKYRSEFARGYDLGCAAMAFLWLGMQTNTVLEHRADVKQRCATKKALEQQEKRDGAPLSLSIKFAVVFGMPESALTAFAVDIVIGLTLMRRVTVPRPLLPSHVHFLRVKTKLRQLQSRHRRELSIVAPTVCNDFLALRQRGRRARNVVKREAPRARDVTVGIGFLAARIEQHEIKRPLALNGL